MSVEICDLKRCSRCGCTLLLKYFETNRKGDLFKLCNGCRGKGDTNAAKETKAYKKALEPPKEKTMICRCGCVISKDHISAHLRTQKHNKWLEWVEQGLDPRMEEKRVEREAFLKHKHDLDNGGADLQRERHRMYMQDHRAWELARKRRKEREEAMGEL